MSVFSTLINYINNEINVLKEKYGLNDLNLEYEKLNQALNSLDTNIEQVDLNLIETLLKENYEEQIVLDKVEFFKEVIDLKDYLLDCTDIQIEESLNFLKELKELIVKKLDELKHKEGIAKNHITIYNNYLSYLSDFGLVRILTTNELEELLNFIINSNLDKDVIIDLITNITLSNIEQYENQQKLNITKEEELEQLKDNVDMVNDLLDSEIGELDDDLEIIGEQDFNLNEETNLSLEEQKLYDEMLEICQIIEDENIKLRSESKVMDLIGENDFSLSNTRLGLYSKISSNSNRWLIIQLDLRKNLLNNYQTHKEEIKPIFEYIRNLFKENFVSKKEYFSRIPNLYSSEEVEELLYDYHEYLKKRVAPSHLKFLINEFSSLMEYCYYVNLSKLSKKNINFEQNLKNEKKEFKTCLKNLLELNKDITRLIIDIKSLKNSIRQIKSQKTHKDVSQVQKNEEIKPQEITIEETTFQEKQQEFVNLPIFFISNSSNVHDIVIFQTETLKEKAGEYYRSIISQNLQSFGNLLFNPVNKLENSNKSNKFTEQEIHLEIKEVLNEDDKKISAVLSYVKLPISKNNREKLKQYFGLNHLSNIYIVLNQDISVNNSQSYIKNIKNILMEREIYLEHLKDLFSNDFTEKTFEEAKTLIEESITEFKTLQEEFCKSAKQVGGDN